MSAVLATFPNQQTIRARLEEKLKLKKIKLEDKNLSQFNTWDVKNNVLFIGLKTGQPSCVVPVSLAGSPFGNHARRELPMNLSSLRTCGKTIPVILNCGAFESIVVSYAGREFVEVVDAAWLLEKLR